MALKRVEIKELKGINRNAVEGVAQQQPTILKALDFDRGGGYRAWRGVETLTTSGTLVGADVGRDERGLFSLFQTGTSTSFPGGEITLRVYDGTSTVEEDVYGLDSGGMTTSSSYFARAHYPSTGALAYTGDISNNDVSKAVFLVKRNDGTYLGASDLYAGSYSVTSQAVSGTGSIVNNMNFWAGIPTDAGTFLTPLAAYTSTSVLTGAEYEATLTYSGAPSTWTIFGVGHTNNSANAYYSLAPGSSSGTTDITVSSASSIFTGGAAVTQFQHPVALYRQRVYGRFLYPSEGAGTRNYAPFAGTTANTAYANALNSLTNSLPLEKTVWYTEIGYANLVKSSNYFVVPFNVSKKITGLASSPAGLLIFGDSETFLARNDPAESFSVQLASGVIGLDVVGSTGVSPARLGGTVFTVYKGEIYAISLGMGDVDFGGGIQKISDPVFNPDDVFVEVAAEASTRQLVARTNSRDCYRFDAETQEWFTDVIGSDNYIITDIFSNPDATGVRYWDGTPLRSAYGTQGTPQLRFNDVDMGDKSLHKMWRRVRFNTNDSYSGTPSLTIVVNGSSQSVNGTNERNNNWVFTLPDGLVSNKADFVVDLNGAASGDTIEPPITMEFVERYRRN